MEEPLVEWCLILIIPLCQEGFVPTSYLELTGMAVAVCLEDNGNVPTRNVVACYSWSEKMVSVPAVDFTGNESELFNNSLKIIYGNNLEYSLNYK